MHPISRSDAPHYVWAGTCDGWHLVQATGLSVIEERMPPGTHEVPHRHAHARQFFFVLSGVARITVEDFTLEFRACGSWSLRAHRTTSVPRGTERSSCW